LEEAQVCSAKKRG